MLLMTLCWVRVARYFQSQDWIKMELSSSGRLPVPNNFQFPFTPYHIQDQFMRYLPTQINLFIHHSSRALFTCLEEGQLGIFESPTGTGFVIGYTFGKTFDTGWWILLYNRFVCRKIPIVDLWGTYLVSGQWEEEEGRAGKASNWKSGWREWGSWTHPDCWITDCLIQMKY